MLFDAVQKAWIWLALLFTYLLLIFVLSQMSPAQLALIPFRFWDKAVHFLEYMPVGFLVTGWLRARWPERSWLALVGITVFVVAMFGGLDEFHQSFVPGRQVSLGDGLADTMGGALGAALASVFLSFIYRAGAKTA